MVQPSGGDDLEVVVSQGEAGEAEWPRGATEDGATCCRAHKLHVFPYFITIGDVLRQKLHSIIAIGVALQIIYFTVAVML